jgi:hypothetical protein
MEGFGQKQACRQRHLGIIAGAATFKEDTSRFVDLSSADPHIRNRKIAASLNGEDRRQPSLSFAAVPRNTTQTEYGQCTSD